MIGVRQSPKIARATLVVGAAVALAAACGGGADVTAEQACAELARNFCDKAQSCAPAIIAFGGRSVDFCVPANQATCLDSARAPQSGFTPSVVSACAAAIGAATCADDYSNSPACNPHGGTIETGGACGDDWQCASGWCTSTTPGPCAVCVDRIAKGGACPLGAGCADGLVCAPTSWTSATTCLSPVPLGGPCFSSQVCPSNAYCQLASSSSTQGICSALPDAGQACDSVLQICNYPYGVVCNPTTMVCQNPAGTVQPGAACGWIDGQFSDCVGSCIANQNGDGSTCTAPDPTLSEGQACTVGGQSCGSDLQCVSGVCAYSAGPTTCGGP